jgi:hypothetical protein
MHFSVLTPILSAITTNYRRPSNTMALTLTNSSGYGDGGYQVLVKKTKSEGNVVAITIIFIDEEETAKWNTLLHASSI